jgi:hypothetical protein
MKKAQLIKIGLKRVVCEKMITFCFCFAHGFGVRACGGRRQAGFADRPLKL